MSLPFTYKELGERVKNVFVHQQEYQMDRYIKEFSVDGKYVGDFLYYTIFDQQEGRPPRFFTIQGPFDVVSHKAPQQALAFEDGKALLNIDYTHYADVRTGLMDALVVSSFGHTAMANKKVLYLGTGKVACESLRAMKEYFPDLTSISYINKSGDPKEFGKIAEEKGISLQKESLENLQDYDYIFAHTAAMEPVISAEYLKKIKQGAVITTFTGPGIEVANEFFNNDACVIVDWEDSLTASKNLQTPIENKSLDKEKIIFLQDLFAGKVKIADNVPYTIYRSTGTPMQNLAVLQLLLNR